MHRRDFLQRSVAFAAVPLLRSDALAALARSARIAPLHVNATRLNGWLTGLDAIGRTAGGINRVAYSPADLAGRTYALDILRQSGLAPRIDAIGNIHGRLDGTAAGRAPIVIGSHLDSVTDGGNFDGPVGTFAAIEVARSLHEHGIPLRHALEVVVWQNEEGGTIGSKLAIGDLAPADLDKTARSGKTIREGIALIGGDVNRLDSAVWKRGDVACYMELHIEQGGLLDKAGLQVGVVEGIVGLRWMEVTFTGAANHAGA
ncbi:MAG: M20/M25/M40 family metallo-hydrolase, partial [bacterium]